MLYKADYYNQMAEELHRRERSIKAPRGRILDRNGTVIADNRTVCTISVIHNQVKDPETVIRVLSEELGLPEAEVRKKTEKRSSREVIKSNVEKTRGDAIRAMRLEGVKVDEDYKRYYPYGRLASKVLGFTGGDNQGIIGLEVQYEKYLKGTDGKILTLTDAAGSSWKMRREIASSRRQGGICRRVWMSISRCTRNRRRTRRCRKRMRTASRSS